MCVSISDFLERSRDTCGFCSMQMFSAPEEHGSETQTVFHVPTAFTEGQVRSKMIQFALCLITCHRFKELEAK